MSGVGVDVEVLRVFTDATGAHGNSLGVVLDGPSVPESKRQPLAAALGFSETIFIDNLAEQRIRIFTPAVELAFAGHPTVGAAWVIAREAGRTPDRVRTPGGDAPTYPGAGRAGCAGRWRRHRRGDRSGSPAPRRSRR